MANPDAGTEISTANGQAGRRDTHPQERTQAQEQAALIAKLLSDAQAALNQAEANLAMAIAIAGPGSAMAQQLAALRDHAQANVSQLLQLQNGRAALSMGGLQSLAADVQNISAQVAMNTGGVMVAALTNSEMMLAGQYAIELSEQAQAHIQIRSEVITPRTMHAFAHTFFDDEETPAPLRDAMAARLEHFMQSTPEGQAAVATHNASSPEARRAAATQVEQHRSLLQQLLDSNNCPADLRELLREHCERYTIAPELIPHYYALLHGQGDRSAAVAAIRSSLEQHAGHQDTFMTHYASRIERELSMPEGFFASYGDQRNMWRELGAIQQDRARAEAANKVWEALERGQPLERFTEAQIRDGHLLRGATLARTQYSLQVLAGLEVAYQMGHLPPEQRAAIERINDPSKPIEQRVDALLPRLQEAAPWYRSVPPEQLRQSLTMALQQIDSQGGMLALGQQDAQAMVQNVSRATVKAAGQQGGFKAPANPASAEMDPAVRQAGAVLAASGIKPQAVQEAAVAGEVAAPTPIAQARPAERGTSLA